MIVPRLLRPANLLVELAVPASSSGSADSNVAGTASEGIGASAAPPLKVGARVRLTRTDGASPGMEPERARLSTGELV